MAGRGMADERGGEGQLRRGKPWAQSMIYACACARACACQHEHGDKQLLTVDKSVEDELAVLLHQVVDVSENTTDRNG